MFNKIGVKIFLALFMTTLLALALCGYIAFQISSESLKEESFNKLTAIREMKAQQIEDYFSLISNQIIAFSDDHMVLNAMNQFKKGFQEIGAGAQNPKEMHSKLHKFYSEVFMPKLKKNMSIKDDKGMISKLLPNGDNSMVLQTQFITDNQNVLGEKHRLDYAEDNSVYGRAHKRYHHDFRHFLEKFGYYDIFLVDSETGYIVYSVFKEIDFATSLIDGPYKDSGIGRAFRAVIDAKDTDAVKLIDFAPYIPSYNDMVSFIASPIVDQDTNKMIGVMIFQMPIGRINNIMTNNKQWQKVGLGESGETYLVGKDFTLRNQSRFLIEDQKNYFKMIERIGLSHDVISKIRSQNNSIGLQAVKTKGTEAAFNGKTDTLIFPDYRGINVLSAFKPLDIQDVKWVIMSEIDESEAFRYVIDLKNKLYFGFAVFFFVVIIIAVYFSKKLTGPIKSLTHKAEDLANNNLDSPINVEGPFEIQELSGSFESMRQSIKKLIGELQDINHNLENKVAERTSELKTMADKLAKANERMSDELKVGRDIQMSMLPLIFPAFPDYREFSVFAHLIPAREVGGDYYDFFFIDDKRLCVSVGDVSGKGVPSALFMAVCKTLIKSRAVDNLSTAQTITLVNNEISRDNTSCMFVTLFVIIIDVTNGEMVYTNAGHNPPYIKKRDGSLIKFDQRHGPVVGAVEDIEYKETKTTMEPGDFLFMFTDGVTEAMDENSNLYSDMKLEEFLKANIFETVEDMTNRTIESVYRYTHNTEQSDDITVLSFKYMGPDAQEGAVIKDVILKNDLKEIETATSVFDEFAEQNGIPKKDCFKICMVIDELLNNIISYGFQDDQSHQIDVKFEFTINKRLTVIVEDDGIPFNPFKNESPDTTLSLEERKIGGLGIHMMRNIMDKVAYARKINKNHVTLTKLINSKE